MAAPSSPLPDQTVDLLEPETIGLHDVRALESQTVPTHFGDDTKTSLSLNSETVELVPVQSASTHIPPAKVARENSDQTFGSHVYSKTYGKSKDEQDTAVTTTLVENLEKGIKLKDISPSAHSHTLLVDSTKYCAHLWSQDIPEPPEDEPPSRSSDIDIDGVGFWKPNSNFYQSPPEFKERIAKVVGSSNGCGDAPIVESIIYDSKSKFKYHKPAKGHDLIDILMPDVTLTRRKVWKKRNCENHPAIPASGSTSDKSNGIAQELNKQLSQHEHYISKSISEFSPDTDSTIYLKRLHQNSVNRQNSLEEAKIRRQKIQSLQTKLKLRQELERKAADSKASAKAAAAYSYSPKSTMLTYDTKRWKIVKSISCKPVPKPSAVQIPRSEHPPKLNNNQARICNTTKLSNGTNNHGFDIGSLMIKLKTQNRQRVLSSPKPQAAGTVSKPQTIAPKSTMLLQSGVYPINVANNMTTSYKLLSHVAVPSHSTNTAKLELKVASPLSANKQYPINNQYLVHGNVKSSPPLQSYIRQSEPIKRKDILKEESVSVPDTVAMDIRSPNQHNGKVPTPRVAIEVLPADILQLALKGPVKAASVFAIVRRRRYLKRKGPLISVENPDELMFSPKKVKAELDPDPVLNRTNTVAQPIPSMNERKETVKQKFAVPNPNLSDTSKVTYSSAYGKSQEKTVCSTSLSSNRPMIIPIATPNPASATRSPVPLSFNQIGFSVSHPHKAVQVKNLFNIPSATVKPVMQPMPTVVTLVDSVQYKPIQPQSQVFPGLVKYTHPALTGHYTNISNGIQTDCRAKTTMPTVLLFPSSAPAAFTNMKHITSTPGVSVLTARTNQLFAPAPKVKTPVKQIMTHPVKQNPGIVTREANKRPRRTTRYRRPIQRRRKVTRSSRDLLDDSDSTSISTMSTTSEDDEVDYDVNDKSDDKHESSDDKSEPPEQSDDDSDVQVIEPPVHEFIIEAEDLSPSGEGVHDDSAVLSLECLE